MMRAQPLCFIIIIAAAVTTGACTTTEMPPLKAIDQHVDLERFMGDWYVLASIPIDYWFVSEAGAHNGIERYELRDDGKIATTYTFRKDSFDGEEKRFTPVATVYNTKTNAEWRMQFMWPFSSAYLIVYLADDYQQTIIGVPNRDYVWIMSRTPEISDSDYERLMGIVGELGHDRSLVKRVPQRWP